MLFGRAGFGGLYGNVCCRPDFADESGGLESLAGLLMRKSPVFVSGSQQNGACVTFDLGGNMIKNAFFPEHHGLNAGAVAAKLLPFGYWK